jgi:uncharacterized repeat protein (TIGR02543 family)
MKTKNLLIAFFVIFNVLFFACTLPSGSGGKSGNKDHLPDRSVGSRAGSYSFLEVGSVEVTQEDKDQWHTVTLQNSFTDPVVVMGPVSYNGKQACTVRVRNIEADQFEFQIDEWDYLDGKHPGRETISYMVVEQGVYVFNDMVIEAKSVTGITHEWTDIAFDHVFDDAPVVLAQCTSYNGKQAVTTRLQNVSAAGLSLKLQEQEANEDYHPNAEQVCVIAFEQVTGGDTIIISHATMDENWQTIGFNPAIPCAGLFAQMQTYAGNNACALRYRNLTEAGCEIKVQEEQSADEETDHKYPEDVGYVVIQKGVYESTVNPTFIVTYDGNGFDGGEVPVDGNEYEEGETVTVVSAGTMTYTGHAFAGWNTEADGSGVGFSVGDTFIMPAGDVNLYAQWTDVNSEFISSWSTANISYNSSDSNQIRLPLESTGEYDFTVYWGDGTDDHITSWNAPETTHTYASEGIYEVTISGTIKGFRFAGTGDRLKLLEISKWGNLNFGNNGSIFDYVSNLEITATDIPDLTGVTDFSYMFYACYSLATVPNMNFWDVSNVTDMSWMFAYAETFNSDIDSWDVSNVTDMNHMFAFTDYFNQYIGSWDVSNVTDMSRMFSFSEAFNQDIGSWNVEKVTNMSNMFVSADSFNKDIGDWDVSNVTDMSSMFYDAFVFNQDIGSWNVSNVTDMNSMFTNARVFNQDIGAWDVSNVTNMHYMFFNAYAFNQDIGSWNVSNVMDMSWMFFGADSFNKDIGDWDVSNVTDMNRMFAWAEAFNQDIGSWDISNVTDMESMLYGITLSTSNYSSILIGWAALPSLQSGVNFHGGNSKYNASAVAARETLVNTYGWTITDGGLEWN